MSCIVTRSSGVNDFHFRDDIERCEHEQKEFLEKFIDDPHSYIVPEDDGIFAAVNVITGPESWFSPWSALPLRRGRVSRLVEMLSQRPPPPEVDMTMMAVGNVEQFRATAQADGLELPEKLVADGNLHFLVSLTIRLRPLGISLSPMVRRLPVPMATLEPTLVMKKNGSLQV